MWQLRPRVNARVAEFTTIGVEGPIVEQLEVHKSLFKSCENGIHCVFDTLTAEATINLLKIYLFLKALNNTNIGHPTLLADSCPQSRGSPGGGLQEVQKCYPPEDRK